MSIIKYIVTGLAGSTALTGVHQTLRNVKGTPRVDLLGEQALQKALSNGEPHLDHKTAYYGSLAGDILSNSLFYSTIVKAKSPVLTGAIVGTAIGMTTLISPDLFGLNKDYVKSSKTKALTTVGYYVLGGIAAGITARLIKK